MRESEARRGVEFGVLGPLSVTVDGVPVPVPAAQHRVLLGALLMRANHVVPVSALLDYLWAGAPPAGARASVQTYVYRLRRRFDRPDLIVTHGDGYVINTPPGSIDLDRFRGLLDRADKAALDADATAEATHLRAALALWRGRALADVTSGPLQALALALDEERLRVIERRVGAELATGRHADLIPELRGLTGEHPLRERFWQQLMLALHGSGRQAEALETFRTIDRKLRSDLGIEPGGDLRSLHRAMLSGDVVTLSATHPSPPTVVPRTPLPGTVDTDVDTAGGWVACRQLPADIRGFVGRDAALDAMDGMLDDATPAVTVIDGPAGVGKTTLAVHWAHRVADRFPDGQLYANLRGFDPGGVPRSPTEVLRGFLGAMRVPPHQIPSEVDAQAALYRSLLSGRRVLVVLDNARDAEQVRPLLPGSPGNLVVVTGRHRLTSLIALDGARPVVLDVLSTVDARHLLNGRLGARRVDDDPAATAEVIRRCAALPLALTVVAARAALQPDFSLGTLATQLRGAQADLSVFHDPDPAADLRAVLSWSFQTVSPGAARLFRLLGLHPGPDIGEHAAASLAGMPVAGVRPLLAELARANVIAESAPHRYSFHDLLRAFAIEQADRHETRRRDAVRRMLDHYLHSGHRATMLLNAKREPIAVAAHDPDVAPERFDDHHGALRWHTTEHAVLLAMVSTAAAQGFDTHAWQLAWVSTEALDRRGFWHEIIDIQLIAIASAARLADRRAGAQSRRNLARAYGLLSRYDEAHTALREALDLYGEHGDSVGRAYTHRATSWILGRQDRVSDAIVHARQAMLLFRAAGDRSGEGKALNSLGWMHSRLGEHQQAVTYTERSLRLQAEAGDVHSVAVGATWDTLGFARYHLGQHDQAIVCLQRAVDLLGDIGARYPQANALTHLADAHLAAGHTAEGREALQRAVDILRDVGHADAARLQGQLTALTGS